MRISNATRDALTPLSREEFENLRKTEILPAEDLTGLKLLREKAANERNLRELYRDRAPFELIQNADDAGATSAAFVLTADGMSFGHDGNWFTVENFRSLADGWSSKKPGECIGHKGLGFRSVLDVTPSPVIGRPSKNANEQFAIKFSWNNNHSFIQRVLSKSPHLQEHYNSWTKYGQSACPVMAIPSAVRIDSLGGGTSAWNKLQSLGSTTYFWLPAADPDLDRSAASQLSVRAITSSSGKDRLLGFLDQELNVVLPFLRKLKSVSVFEGNRVLFSTTLKSEQSVDRGAYWIRISNIVSAGTTNQTRSIFQVGARFPIPQSVKQNPETPLAAKNLTDIGVTLASELVEGQPSALNTAPFYVYFPTEDRTGTGFIVHADFHVEPHRKHLMSGAFNDWLFKEAARLAAGPFLTELLERFSARSAFDALAPAAEYPATSFLAAFSEALSSRKAPFVPSLRRLVPREKSVLAPNSSQAEYFELELSESLTETHPDTYLVSAAVDCPRTRAFLSLAHVSSLKADSLLDLIEHAAKSKSRSVEWWLCAYRQLSIDPAVSGYQRDQFVGRFLVPGGAGLLAVPASNDAQLCLPPLRARNAAVPALFTSVFTFVDSELAQQLDDTGDSLSAWVRARFGITRFEASELLPRAVRAISGPLFSGKQPLSWSELAQMWRFVQALTATSRMQMAEDVWQSIGRLPLRSEGAPQSEDRVGPETLLPAFLLYLPDAYVPTEAWIHGLQIPRVDSHFLAEVSGGQWSTEWAVFFSNIGVSASPKLLEYGRMPGFPETPLATELPAPREHYTGERQRDENRAVLNVLRESGFWRVIVESVPGCSHGATQVIQSIRVIHGLSESSAAACHEYSEGNETWKSRLSSLAKHIAAIGSTSRQSDSTFCRGGGGHSIGLRSVIEQQIASSPWLASSRGPATSTQCFLRQPMHRVISGTADSGELNDAILPFVVVGDLSIFAGLASAGVRVFETVRGSSAEVLSAALNEIGATLSSSWGREHIMSSPQRWRAVRGAVQDIFKALNQFEDIQSIPIGLLPVRTHSGVCFVPPPVWYADPGPLRDAFAEALPLLDADRLYPTFFRQAAVTPLVTGGSVIEELTFAEQPATTENLRQTIVDSIGPYLLAMLSSRSDAENELELAARRLRERFSVAVTRVIQLAFVLAIDRQVRVEYSTGKYYLQRQLLERRGAIEEAHFTLYVAHSERPAFYDLDADAIGVQLAFVLQDRPSAELVALCARIVTRFKEVSGDAQAMKEFMYNHLQVSTEAQEVINSAESPEEIQAAIPISPPPIVISSDSILPGSGITDLSALLLQQQERAASEATHLVGRIVAPMTASAANPQGGEPESGEQQPNGNDSSEPITDLQAERGLHGEEEMKRRLCFPGGWSGFSFKRDVRSPGCGFDFIAERGGLDVRIEVKTFAVNGRIMFTSRELREAASDGRTYFLIGLLDDGGPERFWQAFLIQNPIVELLRKGTFAFEARLQLDAQDLCNFPSN
jgi:hypothetical protein